MYDPTCPNNYRIVKIHRWKRAREEEQRNDISRSLAAASASSSLLLDRPPSNPFHTPQLEGVAPIDVLHVGETHSTPPQIGIPALQLSAEALHQRRVRQSAALGISTALQLEMDELEAARKAKVAAGMDRKGRIGQKLGKLMEVAAKAEPGDGARADVTQLGTASAPLVFERADLPSGGFVMREDTAAPRRRRVLQGKPSSTVLIRFLRNGPALEVFASDAGGNSTQRAAFLEGIQNQCGRYGVVRSVRYATLSDGERARMESTWAPSEWETKREQEAIRIFVRFDTVANAFKAIEALQQQFPNWGISFFSTQLFDAGHLGPAEGEALCEMCGMGS